MLSLNFPEVDFTYTLKLLSSGTVNFIWPLIVLIEESFVNWFLTFNVASPLVEFIEKLSQVSSEDLMFPLVVSASRLLVSIFVVLIVPLVESASILLAEIFVNVISPLVVVIDKVGVDKSLMRTQPLIVSTFVVVGTKSVGKYTYTEHDWKPLIKTSDSIDNVFSESVMSGILSSSLLMISTRMSERFVVMISMFS